MPSRSEAKQCAQERKEGQFVALTMAQVGTFYVTSRYVHIAICQMVSSSVALAAAAQQTPALSFFRVVDMSSNFQYNFEE